jgi:hypothetical protein
VSTPFHNRKNAQETAQLYSFAPLFKTEASGMKRGQRGHVAMLGRTQYVPPLPRDLAVLLARIIAAVKNIDVPMLTRVWQELEYRIDVCRVTRGAHIEHL